MGKIYVTAVCVAVSVLLLHGCNGGKGENNQKSATPLQFPQVSVPSYINDKEQAVNYLVRNFWDKFFAIENVDVNDSSAIHSVDSISFEQAFGLYATFVSMANEKSIESSTAELFAKLDSLALNGERKPLLTVMEMSERYFYDPNSPVLDEEVYLQALKGILAAESLTELDKMQYEYQFRICSLNRAGSQAADFGFRQLLSPGRYADKTLYKDVKGEYTLIFFNNPDCNSCAEILEAIKASPLATLVKEGRLKILAMYIDEDLTAWRSNREKYPAEWIYAYDQNLILRDNNIYGLRAIPSLYLLDKEKRVLLKDAPVGKVISYFQ